MLYKKMTKSKVIHLTLAAWPVGCAVYFYWYVTAVMALPDLASYEQGFGCPALMFLIFRLPFLPIGGLILVWLEALAIELFPRR
jgi:hypothetical protein